jgi:hypothetical protein
MICGHARAEIRLGNILVQSTRRDITQSDKRDLVFLGRIETQ